MRRRALFTIALAAAVLTPAAAARADDYKPRPATYGIATTKNVPLTMRDGTMLRADVHTPADPATGKPAPGPSP